MSKSSRVRGELLVPGPGFKGAPWFKQRLERRTASESCLPAVRLEVLRLTRLVNFQNHQFESLQWLFKLAGHVCWSVEKGGRVSTRLQFKVQHSGERNSPFIFFSIWYIYILQNKGILLSFGVLFQICFTPNNVLLLIVPQPQTSLSCLRYQSISNAWKGKSARLLILKSLKKVKQNCFHFNFYLY